MHHRRVSSVLLIVFVTIFAAVSSTVEQVRGAVSYDVLTGRYDNIRSGAYIHETVLNTTNVNTTQFGKIYARPVIGDIYAQPLYASNISIPGKGLHNVVYVATAHNMVYAFDADDRTAAGNVPLWITDFGAANSINLPPMTSTSFSPLRRQATP